MLMQEQKAPGKVVARGFLLSYRDGTSIGSAVAQKRFGRWAVIRKRSIRSSLLFPAAADRRTCPFLGRLLLPPPLRVDPDGRAVESESLAQVIFDVPDIGEVDVCDEAIGFGEGAATAKG